VPPPPQKERPQRPPQKERPLPRQERPQRQEQKRPPRQEEKRPPRQQEKEEGEVIEEKKTRGGKPIDFDDVSTKGVVSVNYDENIQIPYRKVIMKKATK
jgi:hypothetical protein